MSNRKKQKTIATTSSSDLARASMAECVLPGEILIEILSRLPVKILIRFKSVCKNWHALISSPGFIASHITQTNLAKEEHLITLNRRQGKPKHEIKMIFRCKETQNKSIDLGFLFLESSYYAKIVGSVNGVVCVSVCDVGTEMYLWNPATRSCRDLPAPRLTVPLQGKRRSVYLGFGYDPYTDDYKIIRIVNTAVEADRKAEVYSKVSDEWRRVRVRAGLPYRFSEGSPAAVVNRRIHWMASRKDSSELIVCFDMGNELFDEMPLPDSSRFGKGIGKDLAVVNGLLAIVAYPLAEDLSTSVDVWVMKEYGEASSWTKHSRIGPFSGIERPVLCFRNGAVVLQNSKKKLLLYNSTIRKFEKLPLTRPQFIVSLHTYIESLVSVRGGRLT